MNVKPGTQPANREALERLATGPSTRAFSPSPPVYHVLVSPQLLVAANVPGHLLTLAGRRILDPAEPPLWPSLDALAWHRRAVLLSR